MDAKQIKPFIESVSNVFQTMLQLPVRIKEPHAKKPGSPSHDVSAIIGMSGDIEGAVVLSFPTGTAEGVVNLLTGEVMEPDNADFADAVGELVNMVSGGAKAKFDGRHINISCPSVVIGIGHAVYGGKDVVCIVIPCECDCGEFSVEISFRRDQMLTTPAEETQAAAI